MNRYRASTALLEPKKGPDKDAPYGRCEDPLSLGIQSTTCGDPIDAERARVLQIANDPPTCWYYPHC